MTTTHTAAQLRVETINPAELTVLDQARADATPDEQLIESVKRHGIMQPPVVAVDGNGEYFIVMGHWVGDHLHCRHLERLAEWGYQLTEIDQATIDDNLTALAAATADEEAGE